MQKFAIQFLALTALLATATAARAELLFGVTQGVTPNLVSFDHTNPSLTTPRGPISGLVANHTFRAIDFRPATLQLYALSTDTATNQAAQLYTVNLTNGAMTSVGPGFALAGNTSSSVQMDFNPAADRIRITTRGTTNNNYRAHPDTGLLVQQDSNLSWNAGDPQTFVPIQNAATAYSNNNPGVATTTLFAWNFGIQNDTLVTIGGISGTPSPNGGVMQTVSFLNGFLATGSDIGFDISGSTGNAYISHDDAATGNIESLFLVSLDLAFTQTNLGNFAVGMRDISVQPIPEPSTMVLAALGVLCLSLRTRGKGRKRGHSAFLNN